MGNWKTWKIAKIAMAALAVVSLTATVAASTAGAQEEPAAADQPTLSHQSGWSALAPSSEWSAPAQDSGRESSVTALWPWSSPCRHEAEGDRPHISRYRGFEEASVHGWWNALNDDCPDKADVWVELQAVRCTELGILVYCRWKKVDKSPTARIKPKFTNNIQNRSYGRVNARRVCTSTREVRWRAIVDVDIPGQIDGSEKFYSREVVLKCYPPPPD